jgi:hypothetical protein
MAKKSFFNELNDEGKKFALLFLFQNFQLKSFGLFV